MSPRLDELAAEMLEPACWWVSVGLTLWTVGLPVVFNLGWHSLFGLSTIALATAALTARLAWIVRRRDAPPDAAHRRTAMVFGGLELNAVTAAIWIGPETGAWLAAGALVGAGSLLYSWKWIARLGAAVCATSLAALAVGGDSLLVASGIVAGGWAAALSIHGLRLIGYRRLHAYHLTFVEDLREGHRRQMEVQNRRVQRGLRATEDLEKRGQAEGLWDWDLESDRLTFSPYWQQMLGYQAGQVESSPEGWFNLIHAHDLSRVIESLTAHLDRKTPLFESEHRIRQADNQYCWVLSRGQAIFNENGKALRVVGSQINLRRLKSFESKLLHDATHDRLTGLPNRQYLLARLREDVSRANRSPEYRFAVVFLDLDGFKDVNDTLGHLAGDKMLSSVGKRLARCRHDGDTVARLGGDEFVLLVRNIRDEGEAVGRARAIQDAIAEPFRLGRQDVVMACSIGIALYSPDVPRPEDLLRNADLAMYHAKSTHKGEVQVFDSDMHTRTARIWTLQNDLRKAIERRELELVYQPLVSLTDGSIIGAEALIRWKRSDGEVVSPVEFIPLAEEQGLIWEIGEWVLREACRQNRAWQTAGFRPMKISVNLSARQLANREFGNCVKRVLKETRLDARWLQLELTETALMGSLDATPASLYSLFCMGIQTAIDDFGTGYSSLDYLRRLQFDTLKIDKSFVCDIATDPRASALAQSMITMAHSLELSVVAEGVETPQQLLLLEKYGCDCIQGYLASPPIGAHELTAMLREDVKLLPRVPPGRETSGLLPAAPAPSRRSSRAGR